jgi:hypothetical protein
MKSLLLALAALAGPAAVAPPGPEAGAGTRLTRRGR